MAFWDGQAGAFKDAGRAGGGRHACPRRGRAACGVGRSGRIEGEVGRRGVLWQEKSWARREVRSHPRFFFLGISSQSFDQRIHSCMAETGRFEGGTLDHTVWVMVSM